MKKWFLVCLGLLIGLTVMACTTATTTVPTTTTTTATTTTTTTATTATTTTTIEVVDAVVLGNYVGTHSVSAMGGEVVYNYLMTFDDEGGYQFHSVYTMSEVEYTFDEVGTFSVAGNVITITPAEGEAVAGTVNVDGSLEVSVKASTMGARALRSLVPTDLKYNTNYVGTHTVSAMGSDVVYHYTIVFNVNKTYAVFSTFIMSEVTYTFEETGTFTVAADVLSVTPLDGEEVAGTINVDGTVTVSIKASTMGARALRTLTACNLMYNVAYEGTHTVSAMGSDVVYVYTMTFDLFGNYVFASAFTMSEVDYTFDETGSFTVEGDVLTTTPLDGTAVAGTLNADGSITVSVKASSMGARALRTLTIQTEVEEG